MTNKTNNPGIDDSFLDGLWSPTDEPGLEATATKPEQKDGEKKILSEEELLAEIKENEKLLDFSKDKKTATVNINEQYQTLISMLALANGMVEGVDRLKALDNDKDSIVLARNIEESAFRANIVIGQLVVEIDKETPFTHQLAIKLGDIWDRTEYLDEDGDKVKEELKNKVVSAYEDLESMEDSWDDGKTEIARKQNAKAIYEWVDEKMLDLASSLRKVHHFAETVRKAAEDKTLSKYNSLGEALKACDGPEFAKMIKKSSFDMDIRESLMPHALKLGVVEAVVALAETGVKLNYISESGLTPFQEALSTGNIDMAKAIKNAGGDTNAKTFNGLTALMVAAQSNQIESLKYIVNELQVGPETYGVGTNEQCMQGFTALVYAVSEENPETVSFLLKNGANPIQEIGRDGTTPDMYTESEEIEKMIAEAAKTWELKTTAKYR